MRKAGQEAQAFVACDAIDPIPAEMARREGVLLIRKGRLALSPRERLAEMQRLIDEAWALLEKKPSRQSPLPQAKLQSPPHPLPPGASSEWHLTCGLSRFSASIMCRSS